MAPETVMRLWRSGALRCELVITEPSERLTVRVVKDDRVFIAEPCDDAEQAAHIGERFWMMFVESVS